MANTLAASMALSPCWSKSSQQFAPSLRRRSFSVLNCAKVPPVNPNDSYESRLASITPDFLVNMRNGALPRTNLDSNDSYESRLAAITPDFLLNMGNGAAPRTSGPSMVLHGESMAEDYSGDEPGRSKMPKDPATVLLNKRIVYIALPLVPSVVQLILEEFMYLQYKANTPIYVYINSSGSNDISGAWLTDPGSSLATYDMMVSLKNEIITVNMGRAHGTAALLLAAGAKGKRFAMPGTEAIVCGPAAPPSGTKPAYKIGYSTENLLRERDLHAKLFAKHTGQSEDAIRDIFKAGGKYLTSAEQIEFGLVDKIYELPMKPKVKGKEKSPV